MALTERRDAQLFPVDTEAFAAFLMLVARNVDAIDAIGRIAQFFAQETPFFPDAHADVVVGRRFEAEAVALVVFPEAFVVRTVDGVVGALSPGLQVAVHLSAIGAQRVGAYGFDNGVGIVFCTDDAPDGVAQYNRTVDAP